MTDWTKVPGDCSVKRLFPNAANSFKYPSFGYVRVYAGEHMGYLEIEYWDQTLDPLEYNTRRPDGTLDHDYLMCLCKWVDGSPIAVRYRKEDVISDLEYSYERNNRYNQTN